MIKIRKNYGNNGIYSRFSNSVALRALPGGSDNMLISGSACASTQIRNGTSDMNVTVI